MDKMNQKILELATEAGYQPLVPRTFADDLQEVFLQKFAQLVILECAGVCKAMGDQLAEDRPNKDFDEIAWNCQDGILYHFGMQE